MDNKIKDWAKTKIIEVQEELTTELETAEFEYEINRIQDAVDALQGALDQLRYIDDPAAYQTEIVEAFKKRRQDEKDQIDRLTKEALANNKEIASYKMAISRANDTIKEQTGAIKMLKELLKEM